jgi:outer membrane protein assembly factor BamB
MNVLACTNVRFSVALCMAMFSMSLAVGAAERTVEDVVSHVIEISGLSSGLVSVIGCDHSDLPMAFASFEAYYVHALTSDASAVQATQRAADAEGIYGKLVVAERLHSVKLPYADNTVDLLVMPCMTAKQVGRISASEVFRVLRPRGKAVFGHHDELVSADAGTTSRQFKKWLGNEADISDGPLGIWAVVTKTPLDGADDWSHWEHGPDNNPVSVDAVIKAPYMTQWLGEPYYIAMPAITTSAAGRIYIAMGHIAHHEREEPWLNTLVARNGYNGTDLWTRKLPDGYLAHRSAFIATEDVFYMIDPNGSGCLLLDPDTGHELGRIDAQGVRGEWKWMAMEEGVLYALVGKRKDPPQTTLVRSKIPHWSWGELSQGYYTERVPWGFGTTIIAYDLHAKKMLWKHQEQVPVDSRAMVMGHGNLYFYGPDSYIGCLKAKTGDLIWTNDDPKIRELIEQPAQGLVSTPGFRTMSYAISTPEALCYEGQARMNIVAVSLKDGRMLWTRKKTSNNPNMLYLDDQLIVGIGQEGQTLAVDVVTGSTLDDLGFKKRSCARLTATPDSMFCRGYPEGLTRYDRHSGRVLFNGAFRPSCNDGVIAANGLLYLGPWACDCNLSLMGRVAMCSAGDFDFKPKGTPAERLEAADRDLTQVAGFTMSPNDWPGARGGISHSASSDVMLPKGILQLWETRSNDEFRPTIPTAAGGLVFMAGDDGKVRAIELATGLTKWTYLTGGPILRPPMIWNGRAYVGSGDGYVYALEASTGELLWRFRAAPVERRIMVYGSLCSTWPVNSGVIVHEGIAYAAAGIIDYDGTYVYALDAVTGDLKWQNTTSGHLDPELRKGVSVQGGLTIADGRLWMAGGNVVGPAAYDLKTGEYVGQSAGNGSPRANRGEEIGIFRDHHLIFGGRLQYSAYKNFVNPGTFQAIRTDNGKTTDAAKMISFGKIAPAWNEELFISTDDRNGRVSAYDSDEMEAYLNDHQQTKRPAPLWAVDLFNGGDVVTLAATGNAVLAVVETRRPRVLESRWVVCTLDPKDGAVRWKHDLPRAALPGGILVGPEGRVLVVMENGGLACFGTFEAIKSYLESSEDGPGGSAENRRKVIHLLTASLDNVYSNEDRRELIEAIEKLGVRVGAAGRKAGYVTNWKVIAPFPWNAIENDVDKVLVGEPNVNVKSSHKLGTTVLSWQEHLTHHRQGKVDLAKIYGDHADVSAYAYAEVNLEAAEPMLLKVGTNDGAKTWYNGEEVGRCDNPRSWQPDQDVYPVQSIKGKNTVLIKVTQNGGQWAASARLTTTANEPIDLTGSQQ